MQGVTNHLTGTGNSQNSLITAQKVLNYNIILNGITSLNPEMVALRQETSAEEACSIMFIMKSIVR